MPIRPDGNAEYRSALSRQLLHTAEPRYIFVHIIKVKHITIKLKVRVRFDDFGSGIPQQPGFCLHAAWKVLKSPHLLISTLPIHSPAFFSKPLPIFFPVLAVADTGSRVGLQNKIGHPAGCRFPC